MFKPIKNWEITHKISESGEVLVLERRVYGRASSTKILKEHKLKWNYQKGYPTVALYFNKKNKRYFVHRLVYEAHIGEIPRGMQINHKDGNKGNPHVSNLEVVTPSENAKHAWRIGLNKKQYGENNSHSKLTTEEVKKIREMAKTKTQQEIANDFGLHQTTVHYILIGKTWSHAT